MIEQRITGRHSSAIKYDLFTAIGSWSLTQSKLLQRMSLRFITLVTARYNWRRNIFTVAQTEIANLWACNIRTVKREMARLRDLGWIVLHRQGRRGRVAEYSLDIDRILETTRSTWAHVGPDFEERLTPSAAVSIAMPGADGELPEPELPKDGLWATIARHLYVDDPASYVAWLQKLSVRERAGEVLVIAAPSRFHASYVDTHFKGRMLAAARAADPSLRSVVVTA